jgi:hypothetical protein
MPQSHRLVKAIPVGTPQMLRNDDVQAPADRFVRTITKEVVSGLVPGLDHSLSIRDDDGIRILVND